MTYCVALKLQEGLVFLSDTRTNAGIDDVSRYRKMFTYEDTGNRAITLMTAGNLSVTQGVITRLDAAIRQSEAGDETVETVLNVPSIFRIAQIVGALMKEVLSIHRDAMEKDGAASGASIVVGGQIAGEAPRLFLVYSAGNFIECGEDSPYYQIGETKYGKPILTRTLTYATPLADGLRACLVSMDSTVRSNLSVGPPFDLSIIHTDALSFATWRRIEEDDETYAALSAQWSRALAESLHNLPNLDRLLR
ncbi:peptidase [Parvularcula dongshanensis]|uniref:Putative proteasome-type protease n=1 Tax=Parvularcula dongshanensis TaxID=1173995 RepID=A0A840I5B0_9PROT|nr:peptidase [Parvularcula dongshanensis]MBB4659384.1 putative proteasome-type protease [Parvularcula dongshanensis]